MANIQEGHQQDIRALRYKYRLKSLKREGVDIVMEELKQRLKSAAAKMKR